MKAYICDRCKLYYTTPKENDKLPKLGTVPIEIIGIGSRDDYSMTSHHSYDICPNCAKSFISWFNSPLRDDHE